MIVATLYKYAFYLEAGAGSEDFQQVIGISNWACRFVTQLILSSLHSDIRHYLQAAQQGFILREARVLWESLFSAG